MTLPEHDAETIRHIDEVQQENARVAWTQKSLLLAGRRPAQKAAPGECAEQHCLEVFYAFLNDAIAPPVLDAEKVLDARAALEGAVNEARCATRPEFGIDPKRVVQRAWCALQPALEACAPRIRCSAGMRL